MSRRLRYFCHFYAIIWASFDVRLWRRALGMVNTLWWGCQGLERSIFSAHYCLISSDQYISLCPGQHCNGTWICRLVHRYNVFCLIGEFVLSDRWVSPWSLPCPQLYLLLSPAFHLLLKHRLRFNITETTNKPILRWISKFQLLLCNGPGTCLPIIILARLLSIVSPCTIVYVESVCRVTSLSLTARWINDSMLTN